MYILAAILDLAAILNAFWWFFCFVTGHHSIQHMKNTLYPNFHILSTKTTMGQLFCLILDILSWLPQKHVCTESAVLNELKTVLMWYLFPICEIWRFFIWQI